jgi:hypothetical protein
MPHYVQSQHDTYYNFLQISTYIFNTSVQLSKFFNNQNFFNNTHNNMPIRLHGKGKCWAYGAHILLHIALCCYADHLLRH